jgi:hypothetical protein
VSVLLPPALWSAQATAPASGPQIPFRLRRTRHDLWRRGLLNPCALSSGSRENGQNSVLVCGHTVHTLLMFGVAPFATPDKVLVPAVAHEVCPNMAQTTVPVYLTANTASSSWKSGRANWRRRGQTTGARVETAARWGQQVLPPCRRTSGNPVANPSAQWPGHRVLESLATPGMLRGGSSS